MGNEMVMLAVVGIGGFLVYKSGLLNSLGGGGGGGDSGDSGAADAAPAPAAPAAPAQPDPSMMGGQYPVGYPVPQPYPVGVPYPVPLDYIYLQDNLVGGYCHLNGRQVCWVGPSGLISCTTLNNHDWDYWHRDNNLRLRLCRNIRGRYINLHPPNRFPKSQHHTPHRTNQDHQCGGPNHFDPGQHRCMPNGPNDHPGGHGGPPGNGGHGGPPGGGDHSPPPAPGGHTCGAHQHWDDHQNKCVEDIAPPAGGGPGGQGHGPSSPSNPGEGQPAKSAFARYYW